MTLTFDLFVIVFGQGKRFNPKWSEVSVSRQKETNIPIILRYLKYSCLMVNEPSKFTISINSEKHSKTLTKAIVSFAQQKNYLQTSQKPIAFKNVSRVESTKLILACWALQRNSMLTTFSNLTKLDQIKWLMMPFGILNGRVSTPSGLGRRRTSRHLKHCQGPLCMVNVPQRKTLF